jgi:hypothetical protein
MHEIAQERSRTQAERLYPPLRLVAEIFSAGPDALYQPDPAG